MAPIELCGLCSNQAEGWAWLDDVRYCHGDDVEVTCFMRAQWRPKARYVRLTGGTLDIGGDLSPEQAELFREEFDMEYVVEDDYELE